jgi:hypothetical protein
VLSARIGQCFAGQDAGDGDGRVGFAGGQHLGAALFHVADEAVAGAGADDEIDAVERVRPVIRENVQHLVLVQIDPVRGGQQLAGTVLRQVVHQPLSGLPGVAADGGEFLGGDGDFHRSYP